MSKRLFQFLAQLIHVCIICIKRRGENAHFETVLSGYSVVNRRKHIILLAAWQHILLSVQIRTDWIYLARTGVIFASQTRSHFSGKLLLWGESKKFQKQVVHWRYVGFRRPAQTNVFEIGLLVFNLLEPVQFRCLCICCLGRKRHNITVKDFQRRWIIGCNISNLRQNTFPYEHSVKGRKPCCCFEWVWASQGLKCCSLKRSETSTLMYLFLLHSKSHINLSSLGTCKCWTNMHHSKYTTWDQWSWLFYPYEQGLK